MSERMLTFRKKEAEKCCDLSMVLQPQELHLVLPPKTSDPGLYKLISKFVFAIISNFPREVIGHLNQMKNRPDSLHDKNKRTPREQALGAAVRTL